ncbi:MAG: Hpt domain-containing protein [Flavobacteriales bacterium]|nr:Hpt domain-containing protein [Flavobacteriales bacterium]
MENKAYDLGTIEKITGGKTDRIISYIDLYIDLASVEISGLIKFVEEENWEELERTAHKMIAGSGYMGITKLKDLASDIEAKAAMDNPNKEMLQNQVHSAGDIFESVKAELLEEKKRLQTLEDQG